jgi:hypothetical protein
MLGSNQVKPAHGKDENKTNRPQHRGFKGHGTLPHRSNPVKDLHNQ